MEIGSYVIAGAIVSILVQLLKKKIQSKVTTYIAIVTLSVIAGAIYYFFQNTYFFESVISIIGFAGAVYTYILRQYEE